MPAGPQFSTLVNFTGPNGGDPQGNLVVDRDGNIFGTTYYGGTHDDGTIFELPKGSSQVVTLASFNGLNGSGPAAGLVLDPAGNLFGTTSGFGTDLVNGTLFELAHGSSKITVLASFAGPNGDDPLGGLVSDTYGNLYGTTSYGGAFDDGTVFMLKKDGLSFSTLATFDGRNGVRPAGSLTIDASGNLYGTTTDGPGGMFEGSVFEIVHGTSTITPLATLVGGTRGGVVRDASGNLFGTTNTGGAYGFGSVFELPKGASSVITLASFPGGGRGQYSLGDLLLDAAGNLFGTTSGEADTDKGTVFELAKGSSVLTTLATFTGPNGSWPHSGLIFGADGALYGTTTGVLSDLPLQGTLFRLSLDQPAAPAFLTTDTASGTSVTAAGEAYSGPVAGLARQFIWASPHGVAMAATVSNVFLHGGSGDDALSVSGGTNVLDGGTGSNFLTGGAGADGGTDTFFVDGRAPGVTWSTVVNFHHGDAVTLWGFQDGVSTRPWTAVDGAAGYQGATIHSELGGAGTGVNESVTFAGISQADALAKFTVSTGSVGGSSYLYVAFTG